MSWLSDGLSALSGGLTDKVGDAISSSGLEGLINQALATGGDVLGSTVGLPGAGHGAMAVGNSLGDPFGSSGPGALGSIGAQGIPFDLGGTSIDMPNIDDAKLKQIAAAIQGNPSLLDQIGAGAKTALQSLFGDGKGGWNWSKIGAAVTGGAAALQKQQSDSAQLGISQFNADTARNNQVNSNANALGQSALGIQQSINDAPLKDRASAMLMARMGLQPTAFSAPNALGGAATINAPAQGGAAATFAPMAAASAAYKPGDGGFGNTTLQQSVLARMGQLGGFAVPGQTPPPTAAPATPAPQGVTKAPDPQDETVPGSASALVKKRLGLTTGAATPQTYGNPNFTPASAFTPMYG